MNKSAITPSFFLNLPTETKAKMFDALVLSEGKTFSQLTSGKTITGVEVVKNASPTRSVKGSFPKALTPITEREKVNAFGYKGKEYKAADIALETKVKKANVAAHLSISHNHGGPWERVSQGIYRKR